jgi:prevent-host-death family protein
MRARAASSTVGVRELRQNLSVYLVRVQAGEALRVTDRGRVVALLSPLPADSTPMDALIAGGRATAGTRNLADLGPPTGPPSDWATRTLLAMRDDERC